jgi:hypothetical protein
MSKNPPDLWARSGALAGIAISIIGLVLTYRNNRWQKEVYQQSLEERVLVQLSAEYHVSSLLGQEETKLSPDGELAVEIVNLGMQPIYLKNISVQFEGRTASFYQHDPLNTKDSMKRIEPGEAANYKVDWEFAEQEIPLKTLHTEMGVVEVETTKKRFSQSAQINRVSVVDYVRLSDLVPKKKK